MEKRAAVYIGYYLQGAQPGVAMGTILPPNSKHCIKNVQFDKASDAKAEKILQCKM